MAVCYRHPGEETNVSCSSCGRPICPRCMTSTPVGMRCPECAGQRTQVRTAATLRGSREPALTIGVIVVCVAIQIAGGGLYGHWALRGIPEITPQHEYWRLITAGFLHSGWLHVGFNMYLLYVIGRELELAIGSGRFGAIYLTALLWGSAGALMQTSVAPIVGASGAVFGIVGATMVELRRRGFDPFSGGLGALVVINLVIGFLPGFHIAWGGHIGGLIGGVLAALAMVAADRRRLPALGVAACVALSAVAVVIAILATGSAHDLQL